MTTAWLLPGGSSLGSVQAGQAEALLVAGHVPDLVIGTSAGSLNAAWLAADPSPLGVAQLRERWLGVRRREIFPFSAWRLALGLAGRRDHTVSNRSLGRWLEAQMPYRRLEEARIPLTVTATDLRTGDAVFLSRGDLISALLASCAMPGVYPPVRVNGRLLVDGGLVADAPVRVAVEAGADRVFVLPTTPEAALGSPRGVGDLVLQSVGMMLAQSRRAELRAWMHRCEIYVVPAPAVGGVSPFSFKHGQVLMDRARDLTTAWLPGARPLAPASLDAIR
jgi:NTE family protein